MDFILWYLQTFEGQTWHMKQIIDPQTSLIIPCQLHEPNESLQIPQLNVLAQPKADMFIINLILLHFFSMQSDFNSSKNAFDKKNPSMNRQKKKKLNIADQQTS